MISFKKIATFLLLCLFCYSTKAQSQESNTWYFGFNAGLNFNVSPPQPLTDGALFTQEGCATICNKRGGLLFYTNGVTVYNRNHNAMPNGTGMFGDNSSTQSSIIIPNPGDTNLYYIFTADSYENVGIKGYNFSVVDMRLDGGLGNVTTQKNINLYSPSTERLTAVKAANGIDYWVITKGLNNNRFTAYKVNCNGINLTPVISNVGTTHTYDINFFSGAGQLKASPDGKKICVAFTGPPNAIAELFDFDNNTGLLSNPITLTGYTPGFFWIYGVEFSPNSKLLYVSQGLYSKIDQYDISSGNAATIMASKLVLNTAPLYPAGLQVAPDRKIYIASNLQTAISVINNPDVYGAGCNLSIGTVDLCCKQSATTLPAYIASFFDVSNHINFTNSFIDCHVQFNGTTDLAGSLTWNWDFGDGTLGNGQVVNHSYRQVGTYNVTLKVRSSSAACSFIITDSFSITKPITINNVFAVDYIHNAACVNQPVQFNDNTILTVGNITARTWNFDDGSPTSNTLNPVHTFTNPGVYNVKLLISTSGICNADSMIKQYILIPGPLLFLHQSTAVFTCRFNLPITPLMPQVL
ncbi:MAG: PKD domain-containing protein [Chitinophagaceae bacterium]|nr:PKD domain-containing protein [Chitinophagaceae bacterium]